MFVLWYKNRAFIFWSTLAASVFTILVVLFTVLFPIGLILTSEHCHLFYTWSSQLSYFWHFELDNSVQKESILLIFCSIPDRFQWEISNTPHLRFATWMSLDISWTSLTGVGVEHLLAWELIDLYQFDFTLNHVHNLINSVKFYICCAWKERSLSFNTQFYRPYNGGCPQTHYVDEEDGMDLQCFFASLSRMLGLHIHQHT